MLDIAKENLNRNLKRLAGDDINRNDGYSLKNFNIINLIDMRKYLTACGLLLLSGCSLFQQSFDGKVKNNQNLLAYKLYSSLVKKGCFQEGGARENELLYDDYRYRYFFNESQFLDRSRCIEETTNSVSELCAVLNGTMKGEWCDRVDNYPIFSFQQDSEPYDNGRIDFEFDEPIKTKEKIWRQASIVGGFIDNEFEAQKRKEQEIQERNEKEFSRLVKGDPVSVMRSGIGTRVCKVDTNLTRSNSSPLVIYSGFIENKTEQKMQVRFESHIIDGPSYYNFNDVNGMVTWTHPEGWYICEK
ncbi:UNVERIFIED_ORG: hypothetical protein FHU00_5132 [Citrobacter freundii]